MICVHCLPLRRLKLCCSRTLLNIMTLLLVRTVLPFLLQRIIHIHRVSLLCLILILMSITRRRLPLPLCAMLTIAAVLMQRPSLNALLAAPA